MKNERSQLLTLWKTAFGDHGGFWELFLDTAFSPQRCRFLTEGDQITAALTWFDCSISGQKIAYVYAVVTHPEHRGKGLCRRLLAQTHERLKAQGYASVLLVPEQPELRRMYEKLGYQTCTAVSEFSCAAGAIAVPLRAIGPAEYAELRRDFLPEGSVVQEGENLDFLAAQAQFYAGETFLLAAYTVEDTLFGMELLGDCQTVPGILRALGCKNGSFRCPGEEKPFAMIHRLQADAVIPQYFGFAFD